jgi:NitT/TauT family transport system ATP-binding protein
MGNLFPVEAGISQVRGIVRLIKENDGSMSISKLAEESEEDIDDLLPLIDACEILGFATVENSRIEITDRGKKLVTSGPLRTIRTSLVEIEPFKSVIKALGEGSMSTEELAVLLKSKRIVLHEDHSSNMAALRKVLRNWGVRTKLISYDEEEDRWSIKRKSS